MHPEHRVQIEALYLEMFHKLMLYARCNVDGEALAEEAVQEAFRIACQQPEKLCESPNPQGWLMVTLRNTISNMRKNRETAKRITEQYLLVQQKELAVSEDGVRLKILYDDLADTEEFQLLLELAVEGRSHAEWPLPGASVSAPAKSGSSGPRIFCKRK